jgi:6-phosphofructokinase 1
LSNGQRHGVAVIAEGVVEGLDEKELDQLKDVERDAHGHIRIAEIDIGEILKRSVQAQLKEMSIKTSLIAKDIGYEVRCADPIPYDMEYTRDLGYCAAKYLLSGGSAVMVSIQGGHFVPVRFDQLLDPQTGRTKVRLVDIHSAGYAIARRYMIRLRRDDFEDSDALAQFAATAHLSVDEFRNRFEYLVENEPPPLQFTPIPS